MISRVFLFFLFPMMIIALFLSFAGVNHVQFDDSYYTFLSSVNKSYESWRLTIPQIPKIHEIDAVSYNADGKILEVLIKIANGFFWVINAITSVINVLVIVTNVLVNVLQFVFTLIYQCKDLITRIRHIRFAYV